MSDTVAAAAVAAADAATPGVAAVESGAPGNTAGAAAAAAEFAAALALGDFGATDSVAPGCCGAADARMLHQYDDRTARYALVWMHALFLSITTRTQFSTVINMYGKTRNLATQNSKNTTSGDVAFCLLSMTCYSR